MKQKRKPAVLARAGKQASAVDFAALAAEIYPRRRAEAARQLPDVKLLDWQSEGLYPKADDLTPRQWAWEFLRRSLFYQNVWQHLVWHERNGVEPDPIYAQWLRDFGLLRPLDPNVSAARLGCDPPFIAAREVPVHHGPGHKEFNLIRSQAIIVVNTVLPLEPQFRQAAHLLQPQDRRKRPRLRRREYPTYLRVLDGCDAGAGPSEIAEVLYPVHEYARERVNNHVRAAEELRDGGYWGLIAMAGG